MLIFDQFSRLLGGKTEGEEVVVGSAYRRLLVLDQSKTGVPTSIGYRKTLGGQFWPTFYLWATHHPDYELEASYTVVEVSWRQEDVGIWAYGNGDLKRGKLRIEFPMFEFRGGIDIQSPYVPLLLLALRLAVKEGSELPLATPYWSSLSDAVNKLFSTP